MHQKKEKKKHPGFATAEGIEFQNWLLHCFLFSLLLDLLSFSELQIPLYSRKQIEQPVHQQENYK